MADIEQRLKLLEGHVKANNANLQNWTNGNTKAINRNLAMIESLEKTVNALAARVKKLETAAKKKK